MLLPNCFVYFFPFSWVVFEQPDFCGESYILEKGLYGSPEDWGALQHKVGSTMPVVLVRAVTHRKTMKSHCFCFGGKVACLLLRRPSECVVFSILSLKQPMFLFGLERLEECV